MQFSKKRIIILILFLLIFFAPWMTEGWCKDRLIGYQFNGYRVVDDSWNITVDLWIPFGRRVGVSLPEEEQPQKPEDFPEGQIYFPPPGGYGFVVFMSPFGQRYGVVGH